MKLWSRILKSELQRMVDKWFSFLARQSGDCWLLLCCIFCIQFQMDGTSECCGLRIQSRHVHSSSLLPVFKMCIVAIQKLKNEKIVFYAYLRQEQTIFSKSSFIKHTLPVSSEIIKTTQVFCMIWQQVGPHIPRCLGQQVLVTPHFILWARVTLTLLAWAALPSLDTGHSQGTSPHPRVRRPISTLYLSFLYYTYIQFSIFVYQL